MIEKLFKFLINAPPGEISAFKLARSLDKDFETISTYLHYLQEAGLVRFLYPKSSGKSFLRNPSKMYPENTNLIYAAYVPFTEDDQLGKVRETFAINQFQNANLKTFYTSRGDIKVQDYIFEIGGPNKKDTQLRGEKNGFILADGCLTGTERLIPLYLIGFLS